MVSLEDLWGEGEPQNVPGTHHERPNWRRRAALTLEEIAANPGIETELRRIDALRRSEPADPPAPAGEPGAPGEGGESAAPTGEDPTWRAR